MTEEAKDQQVAPEVGTGGDAENEGNKLEPAKDKTLRLTVPKMAEIKNDEIPTGKGTNEALLRDNAAIRLPYTGFPWQEEANIYIAGHRIGFPGTNSDLAFYDLDKVGNGDKVYVEDSDGRRYTYEVFEKKIVEPTDLSVLKRVEGKNILTLQTCTLPDYTKRLIVKAELKGIEGA
ncbi:sortase [Rubrobacter tropicus]|uniref:Sortase n=2 Tax=Rubrobacter tropicus TaxID=2653851 RepID=A0A6G8QFL1_9ACTN|nr:sortase [Rubrobacter tropicus]